MHGPKVPACRRCNARRGAEVQRRLAERRPRGYHQPRWAPPGSRPVRRRVYVGAIDTNRLAS